MTTLRLDASGRSWISRFASALSFVVLGVAGCVARDAGYGDVRRIVSERSGHEVRWYAVDDAPVVKRTEALLSKPLTAEAAAQVALLNNPTFQAAFEQLGMARASLVSALRLPNPEVQGTVRFAGEGVPNEYGLAVTESISQFFFLPLRAGAAQAELDAAKLSVGGMAMDLAFEVRTAFYRHQADEQILELRRTVVRAAQASFEITRRLHQAGNVTDLDLANEQALYDDARLAAAQAESAIVASRERLNGLMGLWGRGIGWKIAGRLADPPERDPSVATLEREALERSVDLALTRARFTAAARRANLAQVEGLLPDLRAGVGADREELGWEVGPVVELEVPLLYQGQGEVAAAEAEMRRERNIHRGLGVNIRATARAAGNRLLAARERALYYKTVLLPLRERIVNETQLSYNAMLVGIFQLLVAKRDRIETGRSYVEALRDYWIARAEVEQLRAGRLFPRGSGDETTGYDAPRREQTERNH